MITSTSNPRVRRLVLWQEKAKKRREDNVFLAEGIKMLREAPRDWIKEVYLTEEVLQRLRKEDGEVLTKIENTGYELLSEEVMKKVSDTQTPQGALVVLNRPSYTIDDIVGNGEGTFMVLENLQDPGNLGTIVRTGEGAGIRGVIMSQDTVDVYNPKTVQATMGGIARVKLHYISLPELIASLEDIPVYGTFLDGENMYTQPLSAYGLIVMGNEGNGIGDEVKRLINRKLYIPNYPAERETSESLNVAIATAVVCAEFRRQAAML